MQKPQKVFSAQTFKPYLHAAAPPASSRPSCSSCSTSRLRRRSWTPRTTWAASRPLALVFVGCMLYNIGIRNIRVTKDMLWVYIGRFVICPLVCLVLTYVIPIPPLFAKVYVIQAALPCITQIAVLRRIPPRRCQVRDDGRRLDDALLARRDPCVDDPRDDAHPELITADLSTYSAACFFESASNSSFLATTSARSRSSCSMSRSRSRMSSSSASISLHELDFALDVVAPERHRVKNLLEVRGRQRLERRVEHADAAKNRGRAGAQSSSGDMKGSPCWDRIPAGSSRPSFRAPHRD